MVKKDKQVWVTPELIEYGDVGKLTREGVGPIKKLGTTDGEGMQITGWLSGQHPGP